MNSDLSAAARCAPLLYSALKTQPRCLAALQGIPLFPWRCAGGTMTTPSAQNQRRGRGGRGERRDRMVRP